MLFPLIISVQQVFAEITPRGTPIPFDPRPADVSGFTNYYNEKWGFALDVPNEWIIDDESILLDEGWEQIVFLTPDPDYWSTYIAIDYNFDNYTYQGLYGNNALRELENNVKDWCNLVNFNDDGFTCSNFETVQTEVVDDTYIISYTFTEREIDGTVFEKIAALGVYLLSDSEYISIDVEINYDNFELHSQQVGYMLTSIDYSTFASTTSPIPTYPQNNELYGNLNTANYYNDEFGFSIDYPSGWYIDDELIQDGDWFGIVAFSSEYDTLETQWFDVSIQYDDYDYRGISDSQYMSQLIDDLDYGCTLFSIDVDGYTCSNFEVSDVLTGRFTDYVGNKWYGVYYTYTENFPEGSYDIALAHLELPVSNDTWILNFYFDLDTYDDYLGNVSAVDLVDEIGSSFNIERNVITQATPAPIQKDELTCGPGTAPKDGQCVRIEMDSGGCLIATATYGSELAPQVQMLREIRDNSLLQTESGTSFMNSFNDFYYPFSPIIADYERENPVFKEMVKIAITPMITSLSILNYVDMDSEAEVLGYGISLIILNIGMYVGIPAAVIVGIRKKF